MTDEFAAKYTGPNPDRDDPDSQMLSHLAPVEQELDERGSDDSRLGEAGASDDGTRRRRRRRRSSTGLESSTRSRSSSGATSRSGSRSGIRSTSGSSLRAEPDEASFPVRPRFAVIALVGLLVLTMTGPIMTFDETGGSASLLRQIGYAAIALLAAYSVRAERLPRRLLVVPWPLVAAMGFCWLSVTWAIEPGIALRRVVLTSLVIWSIFVLTRWQGYDRIVFVLRVALVIVLGINFLVVEWNPVLGIHLTGVAGDDGLLGDWRGIMAHKNVAGLVCALTILFFAFDAKAIPRMVQLSVIGAAGYFLFYSGSRTSVGVCVAAVAIGFFFTAYRYRSRALAFGVLIALIVGGAIVQNLYSDTLMRALNDPTAFTGRTLIWQPLWNFYKSNAILGSGFGSFWNIGPNSPIYVYSVGWVREVTQGHNGFLDMLVQIGPVGLGLVVFATVVFPLVKLLNSRQTQGQTGALLIALLVFCLGHNLTETSLFDRDSIGQVFLMFTIALLWAATSAKRQARSSASLLKWANRQEDAQHDNEGAVGDAKL